MKTYLLNGFKSLTQLTNYFSNKDICKEYLVNVRWHGTPLCPYCGCCKCYNRNDGRYTCSKCRRVFSVLVGTIFQNTKLPLLTWFKAIYLVLNCKQGISSCQLSILLGVTQKTTWFMLQKIRILFGSREGFVDKVTGKIEIRQSRKGNFFKIRISDYPHMIHPKILKYVKERSRIFTDERICYQSLSESEEEIYMIEDPFPLGVTNKTDRQKLVVDGFWIQLKRMIMGIYHYVSSSLFHRYVNEAIFRQAKNRIPIENRFFSIMESVNQVIPYSVVRPKNS